MNLQELCEKWNFTLLNNGSIPCVSVKDILQYSKVKDIKTVVSKLNQDSLCIINVKSEKNSTPKRSIPITDAMNYISDFGNPPYEDFVSDFIIAEDSFFESQRKLVTTKQKALVAKQNNIIKYNANKEFDSHWPLEIIAEKVKTITLAGDSVNPKNDLLPIFSDEYPIRVTQELIDFVADNEIKLIEPDFTGCTMPQQAARIYEKAIMKSMIPFYNYKQLRQLYKHMDFKFFMDEYCFCRDELILAERKGLIDFIFEENPNLTDEEKEMIIASRPGVTEYEKELSDYYLKWMIDNPTPNEDNIVVAYGTDRYDYSNTDSEKRDLMFEKNRDKIKTTKNKMIIYLRTREASGKSRMIGKYYDKSSLSPNYETIYDNDIFRSVHKRLFSNPDFYGIPKKPQVKIYTMQDDCLYNDTIASHRGYLREKVRVPIHRMCSELQELYSHRFPGLDVDVDEDDLASLQSIDWYMRKNGERLIIYRKKHDNTEEEMKYFLFSKLISEFPEYKIVIITPRIQSCMCRRELTILRLHTTTNKNGYEKSIPATIIKQRFEKYNAMSYQTICKLYQNALVVNGAQEILPQFTTTGLFTEVVPGNDWLTHEQMLRYRVPEQHNLLPNNDCNTEKIMTPLQTVDSANGIDDPSSTPLIPLSCDIDPYVTYLKTPERLKIA